MFFLLFAQVLSENLTIQMLLHSAGAISVLAALQMIFLQNSLVIHKSRSIKENCWRQTGTRAKLLLLLSFFLLDAFFTDFLQKNVCKDFSLWHFDFGSVEF